MSVLPTSRRPSAGRRLLAVLDTWPVTWFVLALPALPVLRAIATGEHYVPQLLFETGVASAKLTVAALAVTPLSRLLGPVGPVRFLRRRRRAIGVSAFAYAALHTLVWAAHIGDWQEIALLAFEPLYLSGWIGLLVLGGLAAISNEPARRRLGARWKRWQRAAHLALAAIVLHWLIVGQFLHHLWPWLAPLLAIQAWRVLGSGTRTGGRTT